MINGIVYRWDNKTTGRFYIGSHAGPPDDDYIAGGVEIREAMKQDGMESFERTIVYSGEHFEDIETLLIHVFDLPKDPQSYNGICSNARKARETRLRNQQRRRDLRDARRKGPEALAELLQQPQYLSREERSKRKCVALVEWASQFGPIDKGLTPKYHNT